MAGERGSTYHVIVVGAGAAGLMAAGQAAQAGARTLLLERMDRPGRKLRISGKGRGNLTNTDPIPAFIAHFGANGRFLRNAFARFFSDDLVAFLGGLGVRTASERGGRVFPRSDSAQDVVDALVDWVQRAGVTLRTGIRVARLLRSSDVCIVDAVVGVDVHGEHEGAPFYSDAVILATGGASYPATGSSGDGYDLARAVGHTIVPIRPALVPIETAGDVAPRLEGLSLRNVRLTVRAGNEVLDEAFGEMLFTATGVSGPIVLSLSRQVVDALRAGRQVVLSIDLKPALDEEKLDARLLRDLDRYGKRHVQTLLKGLLPSKLIPICIEQTGIPAHREANQVTAEQRDRLRAWLKDFTLEVTGYQGFERAIVTAGGVDTREIDPRTMASRLVRGLYFAGEVIDVDADTGGYNLQAAFSTGYVAGRAAAEAALAEEADVALHRGAP
ncbi:MAG: NAD(P)/FAD-dependent oxidoreductase [Anaerolineae bacterium]|jgi:predicted Rossmann fold flavoprotein